ncbi:three-Cys-motif partner protein TcmP [Rhizobium sp. WYCCWR 11146]|uniref:three-Cys-motif partner protein TcmP n=1 Tax=Rhizobium sp. WYCCWR 11146 TaxID=2749833 RepID=UPI0015E6A412|nr:three-Cys-motif partner protein TcmP [Rhizobium sp. WYCCWR 11146]MBA1344959.1 three-Cys-motif partner protein TcmP [Rhizobium sp. WYCCWR 11146]
MVAEVGPWAKEKLDILARYLEFYTKVLKNQRWRTIYVDAFAGGGRAQVRSKNEPLAMLELLEAPIAQDTDQAEFLDGSPKVALSISNPFSRYVFIEPDANRAEELSDVAAEFGERRQITKLKTQAAEGIAWVTSQAISKNSHRGVAFLDPFGARLEWSSVQALANTGLFEVVVNFALNMAINRMLPNDGDVPVAWADTLDRYFGSHEWFDEVYSFDAHGLFASTEIRKRDDYSDRLLELYRRNLKNAFGFVSTPRLICNTRGAPLYYLLWAGPHRKGLEGADYILRMGDKLPKVRKGAT